MPHLPPHNKHTSTTPPATLSLQTQFRSSRPLPAHEERMDRRTQLTKHHNHHPAFPSRHPAPRSIYLVYSESGGHDQEKDVSVISAYEALDDANRKAEALIVEKPHVEARDVKKDWSNKGLLYASVDGVKGEYKRAWVEELQVVRGEKVRRLVLANFSEREEDEEDEDEDEETSGSEDDED